jgi:hypothetical protein
MLRTAMGGQVFPVQLVALLLFGQAVDRVVTTAQEMTQRLILVGVVVELDQQDHPRMELLPVQLIQEVEAEAVLVVPALKAQAAPVL